MHTPQNILVPVTNTAASMEAVLIAATLARPRRGKVFLVHVIEVNRSLPLNAELDSEARRGEQTIRKAESIATGAGAEAVPTLVQAREAGAAICEEAHDSGADAIILGVPFGEEGRAFRIGRTADFILNNATCEVWVVRQSVAPEDGHQQETKRQEP
jgi:nucleotide-binding universal stress UspA family protein